MALPGVDKRTPSPTPHSLPHPALPPPPRTPTPTPLQKGRAIEPAPPGGAGGLACQPRTKIAWFLDGFESSPSGGFPPDELFQRFCWLIEALSSIKSTVSYLAKITNLSSPEEGLVHKSGEAGVWLRGLFKAEAAPDPMTKRPSL
ncbi:uncharacterized protein PGTG_13291 [Puccinia graminis f. sp. tritici CRL 75-36-700-3]|uniref:Uncharacterized protein n=1 Tax=Puccinia graminis f. sp. tritici (strain CRL 75-36-700-3 / race SCCL) TaxID=418459 RepID=E3KRZ7_PUCGT|nr:uncharacterized protein PGTG_13291 [Puccinia graminis f. sp. tritici CRL 75-36-700-3]EFP87072.1 hypothetical protein PGTG_13291 [Puccinia graminis f. sp. tritici CRL 75-36-700-3]